jgi:hypothetical protein
MSYSRVHPHGRKRGAPFWPEYEEQAKLAKWKVEVKIKIKQCHLFWYFFISKALIQYLTHKNQ